VVRTSGTNAKIYTELGQIYIAQKRLELAQLVLAKALELDAKDPAVYNAFAILAQKQGKAQEAFERFDKAAELDANYIDARFNKAAVLLDAGDYSRAKVELEAIVQKRPDDHAAQVALGVAQRGLKAYPEARKTWERVIKEAPKRSTARADAMFDVALLKIDFLNDADGGKTDLERYMQEAPSGHAKHQAAEDKCKEVKCK
ncbi:MAG TPA: tetratricopeptide repeat protein, partial [Kofleriaceae bacterium]|nr:tetratricopeptide repeat protein [Kofleriaceae bacterium]